MIPTNPFQHSHIFPIAVIVPVIVLTERLLPLRSELLNRTREVCFEQRHVDIAKQMSIAFLTPNSKATSTLTQQIPPRQAIKPVSYSSHANNTSTTEGL